MNQYDHDFLAYIFDRLDDCGLLSEWQEDYADQRKTKPPTAPVVYLTLNATITPAPKPITDADIKKLKKHLDTL